MQKHFLFSAILIAVTGCVNINEHKTTALKGENLIAPHAKLLAGWHITIENKENRAVFTQVKYGKPIAKRKTVMKQKYYTLCYKGKIAFIIFKKFGRIVLMHKK